MVFIPQGSINQIITQLHHNNYNVSKLDSILLRFIGSPQSGWIDMKSTYNTRGDFLYKLVTAKAALQNVTLIPGETTYIFLDDLALKLKLDRNKLESEFLSQSKIEEGAFVPNTYKLPLGITEKELIRILLYESDQQMQKLSIKLFGTYNEKKWFQIVALASVIEKESANAKEMPLVSSVIYNRIKKGMKLQMDGTLNYGKYSHIKVTPQRIREDESIYNTYKHSGIPSLPVCNVSFEAIRSAVFPAKTSYLYFMKNKNGTHDFSRNYSTHLSNIKHVTK
ncbi:MAG: endolytic transglycosylase MltG [Sulfurimonas sp.]|nr:endolytic transglycosylase MltG [Sulfurimonas sp.]